jgi:hypothetical protein
MEKLTKKREEKIYYWTSGNRNWFRRIYSGIWIRLSSLHEKVGSGEHYPKPISPEVNVQIGSIQDTVVFCNLQARRKNNFQKQNLPVISF